MVFAWSKESGVGVGIVEFQERAIVGAEFYGFNTSM